MTEHSNHICFHKFNNYPYHTYLIIIIGLRTFLG